MASLRNFIAGRDERVRVLIGAPDGEAASFAREARLAGARIIYEKSDHGEPGRSERSAHPEDERALIQTSDDLVGGTRVLARQLASHGRLVHLPPGVASPAGAVAPADESRAHDDWHAYAAWLEQVVARPTVAVLVLCNAERGSTAACLDSLLAMRRDVVYRIAAVADDQCDDASLEDLLTREAAGHITLLRSARPGAAAARNLGLRATASEVVVFLDAAQRVRDAGWLDAAIDILLSHREVGAVGVEAGTLGLPGGDVEFLAASGFVAPRAVLARTRGFDEELQDSALADADLSLQIKELGYQLAHRAELGIERVEDWTRATRAVRPALRRREERAFAARWRHRRGDVSPAKV